MRERIAIGLLLGALGCGSPAGESESTSESTSEGTGESERGSTGESERGSTGESEGDRSGPRETATPSCDRVRPCIEAFIEIAPADLAAPARLALAQLEESLVQTSAREPACAAAIASYRHDLETRELDVPDACR